MQNLSLLSTIETTLGNYNKLPNYPFKKVESIAIFPAFDDDLVNNSLYEALYKANNNIGNKYLITKAVVSKKGP